MGFFRCLILSVAAALLLTSCRPTPPQPQDPDTADPSSAAMQGVWLSFLDLQDLLADTTPATAAQQLDEALDTCATAGLNTVFFHVRSHSDAWYESAVFPAATAAAPLLTQGFDPLAYAVEAAHKQGLTLHAWVNPYRIGTDPSRAVVNGEDTLFEKDGIWYYNPAADGARESVIAGVREILQNYPVDGIHFDDYFYPDGMAAEGEPFEQIPIDTEATTYRQTQVDMLVSAVYGLCHRYGRVFGVSPVANLRRCTTGACADVARWMATAGYVDYICPQLYVGFSHESLPFEQTLQNWLALPRREGVTLYGGLALYKAGLTDDPHAGSGREEWAASCDILARQITCLRQQGADGFVLFRYRQLIDTDPALTAEREAILALLKD